MQSRMRAAPDRGRRWTRFVHANKFEAFGVDDDDDDGIPSIDDDDLVLATSLIIDEEVVNSPDGKVTGGGSI